MIKINLVPAEILAKAKQKQQAMQAVAGGVVVALLVALVSMGHYWRLTRLEKRLADDAVGLKRLQVIVDQVEELQSTAAALKSHLGVINDLLKSRPLYPYFMSDFVRSVPTGVHVKTLSTTGGGSSAAAVKLSISAEASSEEDIASWTKKMADSGRFSGIELGPVTSSGNGYAFTMTSMYMPRL